MNRKTFSAWIGAAGATIALFALLSAGTATASTLPTLTLSLTKGSITVGGTTASGAVNVVTTATGTKEASGILFAIKPGVTVEEVEAFLASKKSNDINAVSKYGSIIFDAEGTPGKTNETQTTLTAGQYLAIEVEGEGPPKAKKAFTVTAASSPAALPTPEATVRSIEFAFRGPATLHDGELVRFENEGFLVHMDIAFPVKSRAAAKKVVNDLLNGHEKGLQKFVAGEPFSFAGPLSSGSYQQETITAKPGWYVQACFMTTQDGRSHTLLGMERVIRIIK